MTKIILTDIEGTTSSISFVHEVLFPYAHKNLEAFVSENQSPEVQAILKSITPNTQEAIKQLKTWIEEDQKIKALKDLQGLIWEAGYKSGDYKGHIYDDAYEKLLEWYQAQIPLYVYSSGSITAQKLLFGFSEKGDINYLFKGNFDTGIGAKKEAKSYGNILIELQKSHSAIKAEDILFLSDNSDELKAAKATGFKTIKLARPSDNIAQDPEFENAVSFSEIKLT